MRKYLAPGAAAVLLAGLVCLANSAADAGGDKAKGKKKAEPTMKVGDKVSAFESVTDEGKAWKSSEVIGKKVVVFFFYPVAFTGG